MDLLSKYRDEPWFGRYNVAPAGWKEVSVEEFAELYPRLLGNPVGMESRQIFRDLHGNKITAAFGLCIFYSDRNGFMIAQPRRGEKQVKFYMFNACEHDWKPTGNAGKQWYELQCSKCDRTWTIDTSD